MVGDVVLNEDMETKKRTFSHGPCDAKNDDKEVISPPAKKLKQARLPFKPVNSPSQTKLQSPSPVAKKPKLSNTPSPLTNSHGKSKAVEKKTTPDKKAETPQGRKSAAMKGKRIGFSVESSAKPKQNQVCSEETEVSSSSEDVKLAEKERESSSAKTNFSVDGKKQKVASMDSFVQTTQQPHVSTSDIIDLAEAEEEEGGVEKMEQDEPNSSCHDKRETVTPNNGKQEEEKEASAANTSMSSNSSLEQVCSDEESSDEDDDGNDEDDEAKEESREAKEKVDAGSKDVKTSEESTSPSSTQDGVKEALPSTPVNALKPLKQKPLSAKARMRLAEAQKKKEEKENQRLEKKRKLEEEREEKKRMKMESKKAKDEEKEAFRRQKMEEKKQKELEKEKKKEEEEQKRKEKEEERKKKQEEMEAKMEEKKKKQEEKQKQEEEKRQKENEALMKKDKQAQMFKSFFTVKAPAPVKKVETQGRFVPFEVKQDMVLAPSCRVDRQRLDLDRCDQQMEDQTSTLLYLDQLKSGMRKPGKCANTPDPVRQAKDSMEVDPQPEEAASSSKKKPKLMRPPAGIKMKLLQFHENYRPAYFGTGKKETTTITGRNPFQKDEDIFDYEVDSDDEWEEPGESLSHSEGEDSDDDAGDDEEDEDGFFVPHGYLSAGEGGEDDDDPDNLKARQAAKAKSWENELRRRCEALKPIIITFMQVASSNKTRQDQKKKLEAYRAVPLTVLPIATSYSKEKTSGGDEGADKMEAVGSQQSKLASSSIKNKIKPVPEEAMPDLIRLVHGNMAGIKALIKEFRDYWRRKEHQAAGSGRGTTPTPSSTPIPGALASPTPMDTNAQGSPAAEVTGSSPSPLPGSAGNTPSPPNLDHLEHVISKRQLDLKLNSIAVREKRPEFKRICWYVHQHVLEKYKMTDLPVPSQWVNGIGVRDANASPLPPSCMAPTASASASRPLVNKPTVIKPQKPSPNSVLSLLTASQQKAVRQEATQPILLPTGSLSSAFDKVGAVHLPGGKAAAATTPGSTPLASLAYLQTGMLQHGLATGHSIPLGMNPGINVLNPGVNLGIVGVNPGVSAMNASDVNASSLLQQAAASSILASINPVQTFPQLHQKSTSSGVQQVQKNTPSSQLVAKSTHGGQHVQSGVASWVQAKPSGARVQGSGNVNFTNNGQGTVSESKYLASVGSKTSPPKPNQGVIKPSTNGVSLPQSNMKCPPNSIMKSPPPTNMKSPISSSSGVGKGSPSPSLPSMKQSSPKSLDAAIARLYQSSALPISPASQEKAKPQKKTATLTQFFKKTSQLAESEKSESPSSVDSKKE